jgi:thioredoxin
MPKTPDLFGPKRTEREAASLTGLRQVLGRKPTTPVGFAPSRSLPQVDPRLTTALSRIAAEAPLPSTPEEPVETPDTPVQSSRWTTALFLSGAVAAVFCCGAPCAVGSAFSLLNGSEEQPKVHLIAPRTTKSSSHPRSPSTGSGRSTESTPLGDLQEVTDSDFDTVVMQSGKPVLVDFYATWCGPCKVLRPHLLTAGGEFVDKVTIVEIDVDKNPEMTKAYKIEAMPTLVLMEHGKETQRVVGGLSIDGLRELLNEALTK